MSQSNYKGVRELLESEEISIWSAFDFLVLYPFLRQLISRTASGTYRTGNSIHFLLGLLAGVFALFLYLFLWAILWPAVCLLFRFATFYIAIWIRVIARKGGRKGQTINYSLLVLYNLIFFGIYIPNVTPLFGFYSQDITNLLGIT